MSECGGNCAGCSSDCSERKADPKDFLKMLCEGSSVKSVIGVVSGKGGVGKSSVTAMLAAVMASKGRRVAILDADITGPSIPKAFGIHGSIMGDGNIMYPAETRTGIQIMSVNMLLPNESDPVVWRGPVIADMVGKFWTDVLWEDIDVMLVDMPPGTGDVPLTVYQSLPVNGIVTVTSPQQLVSMIVEKAVRMASMMNIPMTGLVENYSYFKCPGCGEMHDIFGKSNMTELSEKYGITNTLRLPVNPEFARAFDAGDMENFCRNVPEETEVFVSRLLEIVGA